VLRLRSYERLLVENRAISFQRGSVDPKFHVEVVAPHQPFFLSEKWDKCTVVWYINLDSSFYRFVTMHACDGRTDRRTEFSSLYRVCITCSAVKMAKFDPSYAQIQNPKPIAKKLLTVWVIRSTRRPALQNLVKIGSWRPFGEMCVF